MILPTFAWKYDTAKCLEGQQSLKQFSIDSVNWLTDVAISSKVLEPLQKQFLLSVENHFQDHYSYNIPQVNIIGPVLPHSTFR